MSEKPQIVPGQVQQLTYWPPHAEAPRLQVTDRFVPTIPWPDPTPEMLAVPRFAAIWQAIKAWDVAVPGAYRGYMGTTGNHARAIFDALFGTAPAFQSVPDSGDELAAALEHIADEKE
jgi:hypothetical protein